MRRMSDAAAAVARKEWFGHPRGLATLFFTEMWERASYYGMRALLVLYMTGSVMQPGLGFPDKKATQIYGLYTMLVYLMGIPGGFIADRFLGHYRAVLVGGIVIACGHFSMAIPGLPFFFLGLGLIILGTGLLKPNVSTMVGDLYTAKDKRRDAGFSIFYMGINLGALLAPLVVGFLAQGESFRRFLTSMGFNPLKSWHWGFGAACVFMVIGLIQYVVGGGRLRNVGAKPVKKERTDIAQVRKIGDEVEAQDFDTVTAALAIVGGVLGFAGGMYWGGAGWIGGIFPGVMFFFVGYIGGTVRHLKRAEALRVGVIFILFVFSVIFWMSFEQASTSLTLFADRLTHLYAFGFKFESSWFQSVQPFFIVALAPVFALIWQKMGDRDPSSPAKFSAGLFFAAIAFGIVAFASSLLPATGGAALTEAQKVGPLWLVAVYFFQSLGELCLSPVGLSTVTKLSPARLVGLMMGVWFLSISIGDFVAGLMGGAFNEKAEGALVKLFGTVAVITIIAAAVLAALTPFIKRMAARGSA